MKGGKVSRSWTDLKRNRQYVTQLGQRLAGVIREVERLRELDPPPCEGYAGALQALEDGARIMGNLAAALHYAMGKRTSVAQYADYLKAASGHIVPFATVDDLIYLLPPSRRWVEN